MPRTVITAYLCTGKLPKTGPAPLAAVAGVTAAAGSVEGRSACFDERVAQVAADRLFGNSERPPNPNSRQITTVNKAVNSHLRNPHQGRHLGHREE